MILLPTGLAHDHGATLLSAFAAERLQAWREHRLDRRTTADIAELSLQDAYRVQALYLQERVATGERVVGWKIGCTSPSIQQQFDLTQPICGRLLEPHMHHDGDALPASDFVDCGVEAELALLIGRDLEPEMEKPELRGLVAAVYPGIELHNYRWWYGQPTSQELISSNGIHAGFVLGRQRELDGCDLDAELVQTVINGRIEASAPCRDIMGGPLVSLQWLVRHAAQRGDRVRRGEIVIPGSAVRVVRVDAGDRIEARFATFGSCFLQLT